MSCSICFEKTETKVNLSCGHEFHHSCLATWLTKNDSCPMCRKNLTGAESSEEGDNSEIIPTVILLASNGVNINEYESEVIYSNLDEIAFLDNEYELKWDSEKNSLKSMVLKFKFGGKRQKKNINCIIYKNEQQNKIIYLVHAESIKYWKYNTYTYKPSKQFKYTKHRNYFLRK